MRVFDAAATRAALAMPALVEALRSAFVQGREVPQRHAHTLAACEPGGAGMVSLLMPAWQPGGLYGVKVVNIAPANRALGLAGVQASYLLFDARTGVPLAVMDGGEITARRTAAASALAASLVLASDVALDLLVVGAGQVAALLPQAYCAVRPLKRVRCWSRRLEAAQALAARWCAEGFSAEAVADLPAAASQADVLSCATLATEPIVQGAWLKPGSHLDLIGSFTPQMREADDAALAGTALFTDTDEAWIKSGELLAPLASGTISRGHGRGTLAMLCRGEAAVHRHPGQRSVFKSVGNALEDLTAAGLVWSSVQRAEASKGTADAGTSAPTPLRP
jgi:ornithine cyclodeaminase/alanine dehydrogenase-like protein (mu-crystallin family)